MAWRAVGEAEAGHPLAAVARNLRGVKFSERKPRCMDPVHDHLIAEVGLLVELAFPSKSDIESQLPYGPLRVLHLQGHVRDSLQRLRCLDLAEEQWRGVKAVRDPPS